MPLYEYQCDVCGRRFELIRKFSDPPLESCPTCGGAVTKQMSSPAFQFKGSGWYITDYAKKDQAQASSPGDAKSDEASKNKDAAAGDKTDTKDKKEKTDAGEKSAKSDTAAPPAPSTPSTNPK
jgi:putative FmdB family regulatory protein